MKRPTASGFLATLATVLTGIAGAWIALTMVMETQSTTRSGDDDPIVVTGNQLHGRLLYVSDGDPMLDGFSLAANGIDTVGGIELASEVEDRDAAAIIVDENVLPTLDAAWLQQQALDGRTIVGVGANLPTLVDSLGVEFKNGISGFGQYPPDRLFYSMVTKGPDCESTSLDHLDSVGDTPGSYEDAQFRVFVHNLNSHASCGGTLIAER